MIRYVALLRGINVGGKNIIRMSDLKPCFEALKFQDVSTFIQSGNVIFSSKETDRNRLVTKIENKLSESFRYKPRVVVRSRDELNEIVRKAPKGFGNDLTTVRYDVLFLREPLTAREAMKSFEIKEGVDFAAPGKNVIYFSRLISKAAQSYLTRIITQPVYQNMTIRNWNTTTKLLQLMSEN